MDKTSYFFTFQCGICHPGGGPTQYDRDGRKYFDGTNFGYGGGVAALPPEAKLDGDYGFIVPKDSADGTVLAGTPVLANGWKKNGVLEPDCLLCHLSGYSWKNRAATLVGGQGITGVAAFKVAPAMGAGFGTVTVAAAPAFPPTASAVGPVDYELGIAAGTLEVNASNQLQIKLGKVGPTPEANCRGCHSTPDTKKSGRTLLDATDVHKLNAVNCTACHANAGDPMEHQFGKGDVTIGSVRDDLDNTVRSCADCHLNGAAPAGLIAPDPTGAHAAIPSLHFSAMKCQVCHIRYMEDDPATAGMQVPELIVEMSTNGTQTISTWEKYFKTNALDPSQNDPALSAVTSTYRWYPAIRWYKGKLSTVKPLLTAYYGDWISGTGDTAIIRPIPLRMVRKALGDKYGVGTPRLGSLPVTPGGLDPANPIPFKKAEIKMLLEAIGNANDTANPDPAANNDIAVRPVLIRAEKVYYLNDAGEVEYFESAVAESHDFAINHNVVPKRDPANPVLKPGPYGAGGCGDCHSPNSTFFFGKQLVEPAEYEFLDEHGTQPNPNAGKPHYIPHYVAMGYSDFKVASLTGDRVAVNVRILGWGPGSTVTGAGVDCGFGGGFCQTSVAQGSTLVLTASPGAGAAVSSWDGCTPSADGLSCSIAVGGAAGLGATKVVVVTFGQPAATPMPTTSGVALSVIGSGWGNISGSGLNCNIGTQGACNAELANGTLVTLVATPDRYTWVESWTGCTPDAVDPNKCTVSVSGVNAVSALLSNGSGGGPYSPTQSLMVRVFGPGTITGPGLSCRAENGGCRIDVPTGDTVTLTATGDSGATFAGFAGCTSTTGSTCSITMTEPSAVVGEFTR